MPYRVLCLIWERGHSHDLIFPQTIFPQTIFPQTNLIFPQTIPLGEDPVSLMEKVKSKNKVERHLRATEPPRPGQVDPRWVVGEGAPQSLALTARTRARARHSTTHSAPRDVARAQQHWLSHLLASARGPTVACQVRCLRRRWRRLTSRC